MHFLFVDLDVPGANEIDVYFKPGQDWSGTRSKGTCRIGSSADLWAYLTIGDHFAACFLEGAMEEMCSNDSFKTIHTGGVHGDFVIPLNQWFEHCVWNQDFPR